MLILPRQARDKHRKNSKSAFFRLRWSSYTETPVIDRNSYDLNKRQMHRPTIRKPASGLGSLSLTHTRARACTREIYASSGIIWCEMYLSFINFIILVLI